MKIYRINRTQFLPITLSEAWEFFSTPKNLAKITPEHMGFQILYISGGDKTYAGQIIQYKVNVLPEIKINWVTEITQVKKLHHFIDEQRFEPYALWHHQHQFKEVKGGVEMMDEVNYALPLGWLGGMAHWIFVKGEVCRIFEHRFIVVEKYFANNRKSFLQTV